MCGIVGYIGGKNTVEVLIEGLRSLEYRGYDSAGIAVFDDSCLRAVKQSGNLAQLEAEVEAIKLHGQMGIGHTRWATHGRPTQVNAHPHLDCSGSIALVHNGIIENFGRLKTELQEEGHEFKSETDTEVLVHLIEGYHRDLDLSAAVGEALARVEGSYAIAVISRKEPDLIVAARKESPLIVGLGEQENLIASDIPAVLKHTKSVLIVEDNEIVEVRKDQVNIRRLDGTSVTREPLLIKWDAKAAEKAGYESFMLKEIHEQPQAITETMRGRIDEQGYVSLDEMVMDAEHVHDLNRVLIVACGTSYHAGLVASYAIEHWARLAVVCEISSEFRYREPVIDEQTLVVAITQSGETSDTIAAVREARRRGAKVLAVTNVVGSTVTREADGVIYTHAGPEIGVVATKSFTAQLTAMYVLALYLAQKREMMLPNQTRHVFDEMQSLPELVRNVLDGNGQLADLAKRFHKCYDFLFLGRGVGFPMALEGALKLKEISYIHAEGYPAGEMKHGPIALIESGMPVVAIATKNHVYDKIVSNIQEVKARDAHVIAIATQGDSEIGAAADDVIYVPETSELLSAIIIAIPLQMFSYYMAKERGCNVDQPRNLAKSVTVE